MQTHPATPAILAKDPNTIGAPVQWRPPLLMLSSAVERAPVRWPVEGPRESAPVPWDDRIVLRSQHVLAVGSWHWVRPHLGCHVANDARYGVMVTADLGVLTEHVDGRIGEPDRLVEYRYYRVQINARSGRAQW